ncbi:MAG: membrane protein insertase YidC [Candidatus Cloacimonetes bacterium]|nr:membrane protein insertase YidC [Candidatus Cloacimonadota bacterium]
MDNSKNTIIALVLIAVVFILSNQLLWKQQEQPAKEETQGEIQEKQASSRDKPVQEPAKETTLPETESEVQTGAEEVEPLAAKEGEFGFEQAKNFDDKITLENQYLKIIFSNRGATIKQVILKDVMQSKEEQVAVRLLQSERGLLGTKLNGDFGNIDLSRLKFKHEKQPNQVRFYLQKDGVVRIERRYTITHDYNLRMNFNINQLGFVDSYKLGLDSGVHYDAESNRSESYLKAVAKVNSEIKDKDFGDAEDDEGFIGNIDWIALKSKYFMIAAIPEGRVEMDEVQLGVDKNIITAQADVEVARRGFEHSYELYLGPMIIENLKKYNNGLEDAMNFGWSLIRPISKFMLQLLTWIHNVIPNWGIAIIILSIIIKLVLSPLTHKGTKSSQKMQQIQPKVKEVQNKYKDNPKKAQQEVMKIYKEHGVSPLGGCLPLILQFPILFALYPVLRSALALRHADFILWINDLSAPDPYYILPVVMGIAMFLQQKLMMQKTAGGASQQAQAKTQKFMMYGMPIFLVFIFKSFPAGLVLYWLCYNILSIIERLWIMSKQEPTTVQVETE